VVAAEVAHCDHKKAAAGEIAGGAVVGRTATAGKLEEHSSDDSSEQTTGLLAEVAALGRAEEGHSAVDRVEDHVEGAAHSATAELGNRLVDPGLGVLELADLYRGPDSGGYTQLEGLAVGHYRRRDVGKEQTRENHHGLVDRRLYLRDRHHPVASSGVEAAAHIRTADSAESRPAGEDP
jgi:hypothetical protein